MVFAHVALPRIAARFALAYPEVQLEIVAEDRKVDPVEDGYDLIIRIDPSPDERLVGRRFLNNERLIVAPPGMVRPFASVDSVESTVKAVLLSATPPATVWRISSETEADLENLMPCACKAIP
jgi:DNA-binding transcriptional LysR family regulator